MVIRASLLQFTTCRLTITLSLLMAWVPAADAQVIHRCRTDTGATLFSDRACHVHGAVPIAAPEPLPGILIAPGITLHPRSDLEIPDAATGCPAEHPYQLRERMRDALLRRDLNALAGLYAWNGAGRQQAQRVIDAMQALIDARAQSISLLEEGGLVHFHIEHRAGCVWLAG